MRCQPVVFKSKLLQLDYIRRWFKGSIMTVSYNSTVIGISEKIGSSDFFEKSSLSFNNAIKDYTNPDIQGVQLYVEKQKIKIQAKLDKLEIKLAKWEVKLVKLEVKITKLEGKITKLEANKIKEMSASLGSPTNQKRTKKLTQEKKYNESVLESSITILEDLNKKNNG